MARSLNKFSVVESGNVSLGQAGSIFVESSGSAVTAKNGAFVAIQFLEDTVFQSSDTTGLVPEEPQSFPSSVTSGTSTDVSAAGGSVVDGETFPQGMTIYGRWTKFKLVSGKVIAYLG